ncbi:hypothetical protein AAW14_37515 [Streptomyces hygroscopicus]|uniref:hypothetical protein n=1 Tax=Streptomyces hygroscopicus TaxID=1912 RepID=UPI00223ED212|nr:hypothetical protein [Streptomyces hygroscopicus]MCW7947460.1 hypothetical protein [Streptomyces hygroscopicus]
MSHPEPVAVHHLVFPASYLQYRVQFPPDDAEQLWREEFEDFIQTSAGGLLAATDDGQFVMISCGVQQGEVDLTVQFFTQPPPPPEASWQITPDVDVVIDRVLVLCNPDDDQEDIPVPYHHDQPTRHRLRVLYADRPQGSSEAFRQQEAGKLEKNVIQIWPAP